MKQVKSFKNKFQTNELIQHNKRINASIDFFPIWFSCSHGAITKYDDFKRE